MAFPESIDPTSPVGTDSPAQGDDEFRALKTTITNVFGFPASPSTVSAAASKIGTDGQWPQAVRLTNSTGGSRSAGFIARITPAVNTAVSSGDTIGYAGPLVVAAETIANDAVGLWYLSGICTVNTTGTVTRGDYIRKSATAGAAETTGIQIAATAGRPPDAFGCALTTAASGTCTALLFGVIGSTHNMGCRVYNSADEPLADNTATALTFDSERYDVGGLHSTVTNTGRITVPIAGTYLIVGHVDIEVNGTDSSSARLLIRLNGTTYIAVQNDSPGAVGTQTLRLSIATVYELAANDYVTLEAYQDNTANAARDAVANAAFSPEFALHYIGS